MCHISIKSIKQLHILTWVAFDAINPTLASILSPKVIHTCISSYLNLPTAFWGLLGPQKDVNVNFTKTVSNSYHPDITGLVKDRLRGPKRP